MAPRSRMTPGAYVAKINRYAVGDPRRDVAEKRAALAIRAARAARAGDTVTADRALRGLHALAMFGTVDTDAIASRISSAITERTNRLSSDTRAVAMGRRVAGIISTISQLVGGVVNIIAAASGHSGLQAVARWLDLLLRGEVSGSFTEEELRSMATACGAWNGGARTTLVGIQGAIVAGLTLGGALNSSESASAAAERRNALVIVDQLFGWILFAIDTICTNLNAAFPPTPAAPATPACVGKGVTPTRHGLPRDPGSCCPGLYLADDGICKTPPADRSPVAQAISRWNAALRARRLVETTKANPWATSTAKAAAEANDQSSAAELCAAETHLLTFMPATPQWGSQPSPAAIQGAADAIATRNPLAAIQIAAIYSFMPASARPRCYIVTPPTGGCSCRGSGAQGGGGIVALALPAVALLWYMSK